MVNGYYVIDSHCHIYPEKIAEKAVGGTDRFYGVTSFNKGTISDLLEKGGKAGIDRFVVQSVATTPHQVKRINEFIAESVSSAPDKFTGLGTLHPESEDIVGDIEHLVSLGLKGVKLHPDIQAFKLDDYRCLKIYEECEKRGLILLLHTGDSRYDYSNPNRLRPILEQFPNLTVIGAHLGGWSVWDEAAKMVSDFPNLYVDLSSSLYAMSPQHAREIVEAFGTDHVLFGTDYPMWDQKIEVERTLAMGFSEADNERMFARNTEQLFGIPSL